MARERAVTYEYFFSRALACLSFTTITRWLTVTSMLACKRLSPSVSLRNLPEWPIFEQLCLLGVVTIRVNSHFLVHSNKTLIILIRSDTMCFAVDWDHSFDSIIAARTQWMCLSLRRFLVFLWPSSICFELRTTRGLRPLRWQSLPGLMKVFLLLLPSKIVTRPVLSGCLPKVAKSHLSYRVACRKHLQFPDQIPEIVIF